MGHPGSSSSNASWAWILLVTLSLRAGAEPQFLVVVPAVVEASSTVRFCVSLLQITEQLTLTVSLESNGETRTLYKDTHNDETHACSTFQAPVVENMNVQLFEVELKGKRFHKKETRRIQIRNYGVRSFIQTDKPLYLPGQTVHFRVVTLDSLLRPAVGLFNTIGIQDPQGNRVAQWLDRSTEGKILQLSHQLPPEAKEGLYTVLASVSGSESSISHDFQVEKYVLPRLSVELNSPAEVNIAQQQVEVQVCAKYTFGQPVPGTLNVQMCRFPSIRSYSYLPEDFSSQCHTEQKQVARDICTSFLVDTDRFKNRTNQNYEFEDEYYIKGLLIEAGTDIMYHVEKKVRISYQIGKIEFVNPPKTYKSGDILDVKVRAVQHNDAPVSNITVYLRVNYQISQSLQTNQDGLILFRVNTSTFSGDIHLQVMRYSDHMSTFRTPHFTGSSVRLSQIQPPTLHTKTSSTLEVQGGDRTLVCEGTESFTLRYTFVGENQGTASIMYLVLSRGVIVKYGHSTNYMDTVMKGNLTFNLDMNPNMAPEMTLVAYAVLPSERMVAVSQDFKTEKCFSNKVWLQFSPPSSVPGEDSSLKVSASPMSLCGISAVDKSVLIEKPGKTLEPDKVFGLMPVTKAQSFPDELEDPLGCVKLRYRRWTVPAFPELRDKKDVVYNILKEAGLKLVTNLFIRTPNCVNFRGTEYHKAFTPYMYNGLGSGSAGERGMMPPVFGVGLASLFPPPPVETVRTFFPETWIWDLLEVGESGSATLDLTVPDTITTWETEAFCLSPQGFGLATRQQLTVFQPFFLELSLPYSIIRGESFELKATVFNYLSSCIMIMVTPVPSSDFTLTPLSADQNTSCLCGKETKTLSWAMLPSSLGVVNVTVKAEAIPSQVQCDNEVLSVPDRGRIDVVTKQLRVEAEGTEVVKTHNWLLCPKGLTLKEQVELSLPDNVIPGSARASVSVLGDIMGRALKNLDGLLQMPYGCGEQNMALLAPNIYILRYLQDTQQLSQEIKERALMFLSSGYQRQLNYKHRDGSYSTFRHGEGNTWLTAFVLRSFSKASHFVYIDPQNLDESRLWLQRQQKKNGCFNPSGKLFNNRMKGGVSDDVTLSAYITAAFLEMNMSKTDPVVNRSLSCLRSSSENTENLYTTALMAYVFSLAGDTDTRAQLLKRLHSTAHEEGGLVHWSAASSASLSVETTAYVLLSTLTQPLISLKDMGYASRIVRWLTRQQNPYGGFQSTQDTVVALQALALFSTLIYYLDWSSTVQVKGPVGSTDRSMSFTVDQSNRFLYQERPLEDTTGQYGLEVTGGMCASVQISVHCNIPTPKQEQSLGLKADTLMNCNSNFLMLNLTAHYFGEQSSSNMLIVDVKLLSGFILNSLAIKYVEYVNFVDHVEEKDDHVLIYIREMSKDQSLLLPLRLMKKTSVQNLKPAVVKIYDYYTPSDKAETDYTSPCLAPTEQQ